MYNVVYKVTNFNFGRYLSPLRTPGRTGYATTRTAGSVRSIYKNGKAVNEKPETDPIPTGKSAR